MRALVLISLFLSIPLAGGVIKVADIPKFWAESGITADMVRAEISNAKCSTSPEYLEACRVGTAAARKILDNNGVPSVDDDFNSIIDHIDQLPPDVTNKELVLGQMFNCFLHSFDAHSTFMPQEVFDSLFGPDSDVHYGIGVRLMSTGVGVLIRSISMNTPASVAGLHVYDRIVSINGQEVGAGVIGYRNTELLKGKLGEVINLVIERGGFRLETQVSVGTVGDNNIESEIIAFNHKKYGFVHLAEFKQGSCSNLKARISRLEKQVTGLILDLRDNLGGRLDEGICIAGLFVGKKDIVGQKLVPLAIPLAVGYRPTLNDNVSWQASYRSADFHEMPLIVLINHMSASASEVVAGALQDYKQAWLVGERSFGKGSVQTIESFNENGNFQIGFTTALFFRPNGNTNQLAGVTPNFQVPQRRQAGPQERQFPREIDLYPNTIRPAEAAVEWRETRPEAVVLRNCVEGSADDLTASKMVTKKLGYEDYQKAYAIALLECSSASATQHNVSSTVKNAVSN